MSRTVKFYRQALAFSAIICIIALPIWAGGAFLYHKHLLRAGVSQVFDNLLWLLWVGNLFSYRPRTVRQRIASWFFLFTVDLSRVALHSVSHTPVHPHSLLDSFDIAFSAIETTIVVCIAELVRRRMDRKAKAAAQTPAVQA